jgi:hypothetical protein
VSGAHPVVEPHGVADGVADLGAELLGHPLGDRPGGDAARLGVADPPSRSRPRPASRHSLGNWVLLPEPVSPATNEHLVFADRRDQVVAAAADGQDRPG